jgi:hypothetical protein
MRKLITKARPTSIPWAKFVVLYSTTDDGLIHAVRSLVSGGGRSDALTGWDAMGKRGRWLALGSNGAGGRLNIISDSGTVDVQIYQSTDKADAWTSEIADTTAKATGMGSQLRFDRNRLLGFAMNHDDIGAGADGNGHVHGYVTTDGGDGWTQYDLGDIEDWFPVWDTLYIDTTLVCPLHNGADCYFVVMIEHDDGTDLHERSQILKVHDDGTFTRIDVDGLYDFGAPDRSPSKIYYASADPTSPNDLYVVTSTSRIKVLTWNTPTLTTLNDDWVGIGTAYDILVTAAGTVLVTMDDGVDTVYMLRSTDGGANWTDISLAAFWPGGFAWADSLLLAQNTDGVIATMLADGRVLYSVDDGVTWVASAVVGLVDGWVLSIEGK